MLITVGGAPPLTMLGVDNSMHDKASGDFTMCRLTLFAPYWVDNRSGMDLLFRDGPSAKGHPLLLGAHTYFDYAPVKAPGNPASLVLVTFWPLAQTSYLTDTVLMIDTNRNALHFSRRLL